MGDIKFYSPVDFDDTSSGVTIEGDIQLGSFNKISGADSDNLVIAVDTGNTSGGSSIDFQVDGANSAMFINNSRNVGIGTTNPGRTLDVAGKGRFIHSTSTVDILGASTYIPLLISNTGGYAHARINGFEVGGNTTATNEGYIKTSDNSRRLFLDTNGWRFVSTNTEIMRLTPAGNLGVGTTSPGEKLQVSGASGTAISILTPWAAGAYGQLRFDTTTGKSSIRSSVPGNSTNGLDFYTYSSASETVKMSILGNGDVGIGTTSPGSKLEVNGDITIADGNRLNIKSAGGTYTGYIEKDSYNANVNLGLTTTFTGARKIYINDGTNQRWEFGGTTTAASDNIIAPGGGYTESSIYAGHLGNIGFFTRASTVAANVMQLFDRTDNNNHGVKLIYQSGGTYSDGLVLDNTGNVGIGTTSPSTKLDVDGVATSKGFQTNTVNTNYNLISRNSSGNSPLYVQSANNQTNQPIAQFNYGSATANAGTQVLKVGKDTSYFVNTNVGIGTTSPDSILHVESSSPKIQLTNTSTNASSYIDADSGFGSISIMADHGNTSASSQINLMVDGSSKMVVKDTGNVGIGTTSPGYKLEISDDTDTTVNLLRLRNADSLYSQTWDFQLDTGKHLVVTGGSSAGGIVLKPGSAGLNVTSTSAAQIFLNSATGHDSVLNFHENSSQKGKIGYDTSLSGIALVTGGGAFSSADMVVLDSGNVGIGTTSPDSKLSVGGTFTATTKKPTSAIVDMTNGGSLGIRGLSPILAFDITSGGTPKILMDGGGLEFKDGMLDSEGNVNLKIDTNGNVGIGTTSPGTKLDVQGTILVNNEIQFVDSNMRIYRSSNDMRLRTGGGDRVTILSNGDVGIGTTSPNRRFQVSGGLSSFQTSGDDAAILLYPTTAKNLIYSRAGNTSGTAKPLGFVMGNTERLTIDTSGNVGIGTTSPLNRLQVTDGSIGIDSQYAIRDNRNNTILQQSADTLPSNRTLTIGNATYSNVIIPSGNVGIGTTSPSQKLHVDGHALISAEKYYYVAGGGAGVGSDASGNLILRQNSANLMTTSGSNATFAGNLKLGDSNQLQLGNDADLVFYSDNTQTLMHNYNNNLIIKQDATDGDIILQSDDGSGSTTEYFRLDGSAVRSVFSKNALWIDNTKARFGSGGDLEIYHDGSNSYIADTGTGDLYIRGSSSVYIGNNAGTKTYISGTDGGATKLYYNGAGAQQKLETTSTGVEVTGNVTASAFVGDGSALTGITATDSTKLPLAGGTMTGTGSISMPDNFSLLLGGGIMKIFNDGSNSILRSQGEPLLIDANDITFRGYSPYNSLMTIKSTGNVGIGTTSPGRKLSVYQGSSSMVADFRSASGNDSFISFSNNASTADQVRLGSSSGNLILSTNYTERMRIDSAGNVGIGTTSPTSFNSRGRNLVVNSDGDTGITISANTTSSSTLLFADSFAGTGGTSAYRGIIEYDHSVDSMAFSTSATERIRITSGGNIGIGTTSPSHKLDIYSNENVPLRIHRPSNANLNSDGAWGIGFSTRADANTSTSDTRAGVFSYYNGNLFLAAANTSIVADPIDYARLTVLNTGNVGIGTTSPGSRLEVDMGDASGNRLGFTGDGSTTGAALWTNWTTGASYLDFRLGGTSDTYTKMRIANTGNVGIGTTSPTTKLHVAGITQIVESGNAAFYGGNYVRMFNDQNYNFRNSGGTTIANIAMSGDTYFNGGNVGIGTTSPSSKLHVYNGEAIIATSTDGLKLSYSVGNSSGIIDTAFSDNNLEFRTNGTTKMWIANAGNIGIGTTSPSEKLHIADSDDVNIYLESTDTTVIAGQSYGGLIWKSNDGSGIGARDTGRIQLVSSGAVAESDMLFFTTDYNVAMSEKMRITSGGNVGIGTTSPAAPLDVNGNIQITGGSNTLIFDNSTIKWQQYVNTNEFTLRYYNGSNWSERLRVDTDGNVGIGTTNPEAKLHVTDSIRIDTGGAGPSAAPTTGTPTQAQVRSGGDETYYLSEPDTWLTVNIGGTDYVIPAYEA